MGARRRTCRVADGLLRGMRGLVASGADWAELSSQIPMMCCGVAAGAVGWVGSQRGECVGDGFGHGRVVQPEDSREAGDLAGDVGGGHGGDQGSSGAQRVDLAFGEAQPAAPAGGFGVDDEVGQGAGVVSEYRGKGGRAGAGEDLGWVLASWEGRGSQLLGERDEQVVGVDGGEPSGLVGVERDRDAGRTQVGGLGEGSGLAGGECRAAGRDGRRNGRGRRW